ncbi:MAG: cytidylate kinase-like family protein [Bacteroidales bacterium]|nr:cytidylate kinase-like family protein [Bacteroidales bacterium]
MKNVIICVGRNFGSGGHVVAKAIAEKLSIPFYDGELITRAAQESGLSKDFFKTHDEVRGVFSTIKTYFSNSWSSSEVDIELFKYQSEAIRNIAKQGSAVMVGRCCDYVLRQSGEVNVLSVFITAPLEARIERVCDREGLSREAAEDKIARCDRRRETYYNHYTFGNWGYASNYDICIDTSILGIDATADYIIGFLKQCFEEEAI